MCIYAGFSLGGGASYIRWGRTTCNDTEGTELLYAGAAAGSMWSERGGGANYICLPDEPEFLQTTPGVQGARGRVYGAGYFLVNSPDAALGDLLLNNVPCAACYTAERGDKIMIPSKVTCPPSWTREYYGYLMSQNSATAHRISYECMDKDAEPIVSSEDANGGALFDFSEVYCHGINCPPYVEGNELSCVMCTK